ncbi:MAG: heat shock protein Hsp20 family [Actinobacteria bacterium]|jgi:HSP20 family protein|nr:heat shock protein Hsp20 family [Actinomycetota bacterium]
MAVRRWDPFRDLLGIQNEMNRLFGRTYGPGESAEAETQGSWVPPLDVYETQDRYIITAELAGMTTGDVDITVEDNVLTLRGERTFYGDVPEESFHRIERRFGPFQRRVALPQGADTAHIDASMADGLLTIEVAKVAKAQPVRVEVKAGPGSPWGKEAASPSGNERG